MPSPHVLVLGSYPAAQPRHGGQVRLAQVVQAYRARGHRVTLATFYPGHGVYHSAGLGPADVALPLEGLRTWRGQNVGFLEDLVSGDLVGADDARIAALESHAGPVDLVHLEQPWLLPVAQRLRERQRVGAFRLVYGSQNIEWRLKQAIFQQYQLTAPPYPEAVQAIEALERACAQAADIVAAVTEEDARELQSWTRSPVLLASNGIAPWQADPQRVAMWRERLGPDPLALYVASAHPPNIAGFTEACGDSLAPLAPSHRIVLAGGAAEHIIQSAWYKSWEPLNARRVEAVGVVDDDDLSALRELAHTFILPVTSGGGSNLKTAEALYSRKHVIATPLAMRGFEAMAQGAGMPGLCIAAPGRDFIQALERSLDAPLPVHDAASIERLESLTWAHTLRALCDAVAGALNDAAGGAADSLPGRKAAA